MHRKSSLRDALGDIRAKLKKTKLSTGKLRGRYLFRAAVRLVFEYMDWITGDPATEDIGDDVAANVRLAQRRRTQEKRGLTIEDRSALLTKPHHRTKENKVHIMNLMKTLRAFRKYPDNLKHSVAAVCRYQYLGPGRVIVHQGHPAHSMYYIVKGEVTLTKTVTDHVTGDVSEMNIGTMGPGDMFGEIALLHSISRTTTVTSKSTCKMVHLFKNTAVSSTTCTLLSSIQGRTIFIDLAATIDLFYIVKNDFDRLLKNILIRDWNVLQDALVTFNYFKTWDESTIRECCILSKIKNFEPNEILLGDGKGMVNYVYFLLAGECHLIEHMIIHESKSFGKVKFKLCENEDPRETSSIRRLSRRDERERIQVEEVKSDGKDEPIDDAELMLSSSPGGKIDEERMSVITTTLQEVVNQWHEITEVAAMLMRQPSVSSQQTYPPGVHTVFMQVCKFFRGACFGLGEEMRNRRIVSVTPVRCLLVPRYWLLEHNRANIWERVRLFMESKYPTRDELLKHFVTNRRWMRFKHRLVADIISNGKNVPNDTTIHDVPYSIRINENIDGLWG